MRLEARTIIALCALWIAIAAIPPIWWGTIDTEGSSDLRSRARSAVGWLKGVRSAPDEVRIFTSNQPWTLRDPCMSPFLEHRRGNDYLRWHDVQTGELVVLENLQVVLVRQRHWCDVPGGDFFAALRGMNPSIASASLEPPIEPFLVLQEGGGVEGLELQIFLSASGEMITWRPQDLDGERTLSVARRHSVPRVMSRSLIRQLESSAMLSSLAESLIVWHRGFLDGSAISLILFDGSKVRRCHFVNRTKPSDKDVLEVVHELRRLSRQIPHQRAPASNPEPPPL